MNNDEINPVKSVADRVAISAENARLFEDHRPRRTHRLSDHIKIRSTNIPTR
jgi:hypothetical protein